MAYTYKVTAHDRDRTRAQSGGHDATRACAIDPAGLACRAGRGDVHKKASCERANSPRELAPLPFGCVLPLGTSLLYDPHLLEIVC